MSCCGNFPIKKSSVVISNMPDNPIILNGVKVIYLGVGDLKFEQSSSGNSYYFSNIRRIVDIHPDDVNSILSNSYFILHS